MTKKELLEKYKKELETLRNVDKSKQKKEIVRICSSLNSEYKDIITNVRAWYSLDKGFANFDEDIDLLQGKLDLYISKLPEDQINNNNKKEEIMINKKSLFSEKALGIVSYLSLLITITGFVITIMTVNSVNRERDRKWNVEYVNNLRQMRERILINAGKNNPEDYLTKSEFNDFWTFLTEAEANFTKNQKKYCLMKKETELNSIKWSTETYVNNGKSTLTYAKLIEVLKNLDIKE